MALSVSLTDLIRRAQLGTSVIPRPRAALLTEETLRTISMAVAMYTDFIPFALAIDAFTALTLEAIRATPSIVQILAERGDLATISLSPLVSELGVFNSRFRSTSFDVLGHFIDPGEFYVSRREVTSRNHIDLNITFFIGNVPIAVM